MQVPVRVLDAARLRVSPPIVAALASSTVVFLATPFLIRPVAERYGVSAGAAGAISTGQLAGFVVASWFAGRFLRPVRSTLIAIALIGMAANLASAFAPSLAVLVGFRFGSGLSLGLAAWFAWQAAFGDDRRTGDTAVIGPIVGIIAPPAVAALISLGETRATFIALAIAAGSPLLLAHHVETIELERTKRTRNRPTRAAVLILVALGCITMGGSAVFVYAAAIGVGDVGVSTVVVALLFSGNAIVAIPAAKWHTGTSRASTWFGVTGVLAYLMAAVHVVPLYCVVVVIWGFAFFRATPAAFKLLASRSRYPEERAGDAQAVMAFGRVFGPMIGGALFAANVDVAHGVVASGLMLSGALLLLLAEQRTSPVVAADTTTTGS